MIEFKKDQLVAVYGSLRTGMGNSPLIERNIPKSDYAGAITQRVKGYSMVSLGGFPAVYHDEEGEITIEVYRVPPELMPSLDGLEGHPRWYKRELIRTEAGDAWIYVMDDCDKSRPVDCGDWVKYRTS